MIWSSELKGPLSSGRFTRGVERQRKLIRRRRVVNSCNSKLGAESDTNSDNWVGGF